MRELNDSRLLLQTTLLGIGNVVICTDAQGNVTLINPVAQQLTEWRQEEVAGRPLETVFRIVDQDLAGSRPSALNCASCGYRFSPGSVKKNVEPAPGLDFTHIVPPCLSTIFLQMVSPSPVPLGLLWRR